MNNHGLFLFLCLCPLRLAIMLNFKNIESGLDFTCYANYCLNDKNASQRITNSFRRMSVSINRCINRGKHIYTCLVGNGDVLIDSKTIILAN